MNKSFDFNKKTIYQTFERIILRFISGKRSFNHRASISIVALISITLLMIIGVSLINLVYFSMMNIDREAEINRGKWFLEGRINDYFDGIISGKFPLTLGDYKFIEPIEGIDQSYEFEVFIDEDSYVLHATMQWKEKYPVEEWIEFSRLNLFDYAMFFNDDISIALEENMLVYGNIGARGSFEVDAGDGGKFLYYASPTYIPSFEYYESYPSYSPTFFSNDLSGLLERPYLDFSTKSLTLSSTAVLEKNEMMDDLKLPEFLTIWESYVKYFDRSWVLDSYSFFDTETIVNYLDSTKQLVAYGNGYSTSFDINADSILYVYIKKLANNYLYQTIDSMDYAYYYGSTSRDLYYQLDDGELNLNASDYPLSVMLSEEAYDLFGHYLMTGDSWSYLSLDESIESVYFGSVSASTRLVKGNDFQYYPVKKAIEIENYKFYEDYTALVGEGDGYDRAFLFDSSGSRYYIYQGGDRTTDFSSYGGYITFNDVPADGELIQAAIDLPTFYFQKSPPKSGTGIFIDMSEDVLVLDLNDIQNYPENGVIISFVPLLIKGEADHPLAVISKENIYIQNVNPELEGEPVFLASEKGVWIYRPTGVYENEINKCVIFTPMDGIYTIYENGQIENPEVVIYGSVFFSGESPTEAMDFDYFEKYFLYYDGISSYLDEPPFSYFPLPVNVEMIRRN